MTPDGSASRSELCLDRMDGQAVALLAAVAAALAHGLVDEDPLSASPDTALAVATLLRRALLVVDDDRHARRVAQHALGLVEAVSRPHLGSRRPVGVTGELLRVVTADDDAAGPLRRQRPRQLGDRDDAGDLLPAGHRDRGVVQELVGDVDVADTAARIERLPEWKNVPSPMFWNMCGRSVKAASSTGRPRRPCARCSPRLGPSTGLWRGSRHRRRRLNRPGAWSSVVRATAAEERLAGGQWIAPKRPPTRAARGGLEHADDNRAPRRRPSSGAS